MGKSLVSCFFETQCIFVPVRCTLCLPGWSPDKGPLNVCVCVCVCVRVGAVVAGAMRRVDGAGQFVSEHSPMSQRESVALR